MSTPAGRRCGLGTEPGACKGKMFIANSNFLPSPLKTNRGTGVCTRVNVHASAADGAASPPSLAGTDQMSSGARSSRPGTRMPHLPHSCRQETRGERVRERWSCASALTTSSEPCLPRVSNSFCTQELRLGQRPRSPALVGERVRSAHSRVLARGE